MLGLAADGFEISMYVYVKVHFQKKIISENKVHCVLHMARTLTRTETRTRERKEGNSVDTHSLIHLPRRSGNNCDLPFGNCAR